MADAIPCFFYMRWMDTPASSAIGGFAYDPRRRVLTIAYKSGGRYEYRSVPPTVAEGLRQASSKGSFVTTHIIGQFAYARVTACEGVLGNAANHHLLPAQEALMPRGDKSKYTDKQERQADHIAEGYEKRGVGVKEAERRAWATVNKETGGGKKSGSGRGKKENHEPSRKGGKRGGKAAASRPAAQRSASAKKAAATRKKRG
jgi:plasmid stabilization system protein ParE